MGFTLILILSLYFAIAWDSADIAVVSLKCNNYNQKQGLKLQSV